MRQRVFLNDQGLYVDCIIKDGRIFFEFEKDLEVLNNMIRIVREEDVINVLIGLKRILKITREGITRENQITTTEIRILCAIANRIKYLEENGHLKTRTLQDEVNSILSELESLPRGWVNEQQHHSELHTHFIEILNAEEFIEFLNRYDITYPMNNDGELDFKNGSPLTYNEIVEYGYKDNLINALRLDVSKQSKFKDLTLVVNNNRRELLKRVTDDKIFEKHNNPDIQEVEKEIEEVNDQIDEITNKFKNNRKELKNHLGGLKTKLNDLQTKRKKLLTDVLYDELLVTSLDKLKREEIEYTEISFSTANRLKYFSEKHKDDDSFNLLYSIRRETDVKNFQNAAGELEDLLNNGKVIGVDVMGFETSLVGLERENFKNKLMWLLPVLHIHPNSLLRLHASEFPDTYDNFLQSLKILDESSNELNKACKDLFGRTWGIIPPPRIRIGHGVNITQSPELVELIHKYDITVEINVSSNYALGQIDSIEEIPLDFYKKNNIKYVISTDGGGVYSTSILQEENLLRKDKGEIEAEKEQIELGRKGPGGPSKDDLHLFKELKREVLDKAEQKHYSNYIDALDDETIIKGVMTDEEFVEYEIQNLDSYIMDLDPNFDYNYYSAMIEVVRKYNSDKSFKSKMLLFLLERDLFPERETAFKTLHFLENFRGPSKNPYDYNPGDEKYYPEKHGLDSSYEESKNGMGLKIDYEMHKVFEMVKDEYESLKYELRQKYNPSGESIR